jgi:hypothetical protein
MPDYPRDYDPTGGRNLKRLPPPVQSEQNERYIIAARPVFGRKVVPLVAESMEPICPDECRMIDFGGCTGKCRLMSCTEKEEPAWPTPKIS